MLSEFICTRCGIPVTVAHTAALVDRPGVWHTCDDGQPGLLDLAQFDGSGGEA